MLTHKIEAIDHRPKKSGDRIKFACVATLKFHHHFNVNETKRVHDGQTSFQWPHSLCCTTSKSFFTCEGMAWHGFQFEKYTIFGNVCLNKMRKHYTYKETPEEWKDVIDHKYKVNCRECFSFTLIMLKPIPSFQVCYYKCYTVAWIPIYFYSIQEK